VFPQQCFHGWANRGTFEETSRITNVSTTMFPSLPRASEFAICYVALYNSLLTVEASANYEGSRFDNKRRCVVIL
jgi:hypothetical protein